MPKWFKYKLKAVHCLAGCFGVINLDVQATYHTVEYQGVVSDSFIRAPELDIYYLLDI